MPLAWRFDALQVIDWNHASDGAAMAESFWANHYAPRAALRKLADGMRAALGLASRGDDSVGGGGGARPLVVYCDREGSPLGRNLGGAHRSRLLSALKAAVGDAARVEIFGAAGAPRLSLAEQAALFADAAVVIGPHGAALSNLAFCPPRAHAVLLPERTGNRVFEHLSAALDLRVSTLTLISADQHGEYEVDVAAAHAAAGWVRQLLIEDGRVADVDAV